ncbi:hypothetical protein GCM10027569_43010 [Flindersiella endophytica]
MLQAERDARRFENAVLQRDDPVQHGVTRCQHRKGRQAGHGGVQLCPAFGTFVHEEIRPDPIDDRSESFEARGRQLDSGELLAARRSRVRLDGAAMEVS